MTDNTQRGDTDGLASGGGHATIAGVEFEAHLAAYFAAHAMAGAPLGQRFGLPNARVLAVRLETEAPLDDLLLETDQGGFVAIQAKTSLSLSAEADSGFGKVIDQVVRYLDSAAGGNGAHGWDRPINPELDRLVIAVGPGASKRLRSDLAEAFARFRNDTPPDEVVPQAIQSALKDFRAVFSAVWLRVKGSAAPPEMLTTAMQVLRIIPFDFEGSDRHLATVLLRQVVGDAAHASHAYTMLVTDILVEGRRRGGFRVAGMRSALTAAGLAVDALPTYRADIEKLLDFSDAVGKSLDAAEQIEVPDGGIHISRDCFGTVIEAAKTGSLLLTGEPGSGKTAVLHALANALRSEADVVMIAVDQIPVQNIEGLSHALGIGNSIRDLLANWRTGRPRYLLIDALDASRGNPTEAVLHALIEAALSIQGTPWRVVASIRTFDLEYGERFRRLFKGGPPNAAFANPAFPEVRHVNVSAWTDREFGQLCEALPRLRHALDASGPRLQELARIPFNSNLIVQLMQNGLAPDAFASIETQARLLECYWSARIQSIGSEARRVLRAITNEMVDNRAMQVAFGDVEATGGVVDELQRSGMLSTIRQRRYIVFRHHILFDFVLGKEYLNPYNTAAFLGALTRDKGSGLLLAPALGFALRDLWAEPVDRKLFWTTVLDILGSRSYDPIAASAVAKAACDLVVAEEDIDCLMDALAALSTTVNTDSALMAIALALEIRIKDGNRTPLAPWCVLAERLATRGTHFRVARVLLILLAESTAPRNDRALGRAARKLLADALTMEPYPDGLVRMLIRYVVETASEETDAAVALLRRLISPERAEFVHNEIPALSFCVGRLIDLAPELVSELYVAAFSRGVTSEEVTMAGVAGGVGLLSTRKQDYGTARYQLARKFPTFLSKHPQLAVETFADSVEGYILVDHVSGHAAPQRWTFQVDGRKRELVQDLSSIWAWDADSRRNGENAGLPQHFTDAMLEMPADSVRQLFPIAVHKARFAWIWARLFAVTAKRVDVLGSLMAPYATRVEFILCEDTRKDVIDCLGAIYPTVDQQARATFEHEVLAIDFSQYREPEAARSSIVRRTFGTIGADNLVTEAARAALAQAAAEGLPPKNDRPFTVEITSSKMGVDDLLDRAGVPASDTVGRELAREAEELLDVARQEIPDDTAASTDGVPVVQQMVSRALALYERFQQLQGDALAPVVQRYVTHAVVEASRAGVTTASPDAERIASIALAVSESPFPEADAEAEADFEKHGGWGSPAPRIEAAQALMDFVTYRLACQAQILGRIEHLARDPHPAVRAAICISLVNMWDVDRELMWRLANRLADEERNLGVLGDFVRGFALSAVHHAPAEIESIVERISLAIAERDPGAGRLLRESMAIATCLLWCTHDVAPAYARFQRWLDSPHMFERELASSCHSAGEVITHGIGDPEDESAARLRGRCQDLLRAISSAAATAVTASHSAKTAPTMDQSWPVDLLDQVVNQVYFGIGAFAGNKTPAPLHKPELKRIFVREVRDLLMELARTCPSRSLYNFVGAVKFLLEGAPETCFDLVAALTLERDEMLGSQNDLVSDDLVSLIGVAISDFREIFADNIRRSKLVSVLEVLSGAGSAGARRLLYRLPDVLR